MTFLGTASRHFLRPSTTVPRAATLFKHLPNDGEISRVQIARNFPGSRSHILGPSPILPPLIPLSQSRPFRVTPARAIPMPALLLIKNALKIGTIFVGRFFRGWYRRKSNEEKREFKRRVWSHRSKLWWSAVALGSAVIAWFATHLERTPMTGRLRWVALTRKQVNELSQLELSQLCQLHGPNLVSEDTRLYQNIKQIIDNLIQGNRDISVFNDLKWKLHVVDRKDIQNALVLSSGDIFVFTGLLQTLENDDEIASILGHEMAHRVLGHDLEKASRAHILDCVFIVLAGVVWFLAGSDLLSFISQNISEKILRVILELPYGRELEKEADVVGLELSAKACYDVRSSSNVWTTMFLRQKIEGNIGADSPVTTYFSTHPSDLERANALDAEIPSALHKRKACNCPPLPHLDPRRPLKFLKTFLDTLDEEEMASLRRASSENRLKSDLEDLITKKRWEKMEEDHRKELDAVKTRIKKAEVLEERTKEAGSLEKVEKSSSPNKTTKSNELDDEIRPNSSEKSKVLA